MNRHKFMHLLAAVLVAPLTGAVVVATAPSAAAAPTVDTAKFSGGFHSTCTLPAGLEGPEDGPYSCSHKATSVACAAVVDSDTVNATVKLCHADLLSGKTSGSATNVYPDYYAWTCDNGAGTGSFSYRPSDGETAFIFPVNLVVVGSNISITGSYTQAGTGRNIVVRATIPAICGYDTNSSGGYEGTVTPA